jgi:hypothetical protein
MTRVSKNLMDPAEKSLQVVIWGLAAIIILIPLIIAPQVLGGGKPDLFNIPRFGSSEPRGIPISLANTWR